MNAWLFLIALIVAIVILIISAIFVVVAAVYSVQVIGFIGDDALRSAHSYLTTAAVLSWSAVALGVFILIGWVVIYFSCGPGAFDAKTHEEVWNKIQAQYAEEHVSRGVTIGLIVLLFVIGGLSLANGILAAMAAAKLSPYVQDPAAKHAYRYSIGAAVFGIAGIVLLAIALLMYWIYRRTTKRTVMTAMADAGVGMAE